GLSTVEHFISHFKGGLAVAGIFMTLILSLFAWVVYTSHALSISMASVDGKIAALDAKIDMKVAAIDTKLADINNQIAKLSLRQSANSPVDPQSIQDAKSILNTAKATGIKIPVEVVKETGIKFI